MPVYAPSTASNAITFESSTSTSVTGPTAFALVVALVTVMVVLYSLVEPSELVANIVMLSSVPDTKPLLFSTVTKPVLLSILKAPSALSVNA